MQDSPEKEMILASIARFLQEDVRPLVSDSRVSFRLLVAAHLAGVVAMEGAAEETHDVAELTRLAGILDGPGSAPTRAERRQLIAKNNRRLAELIRRGELAADARRQITDHVFATLRDKLSVNNVRFDAASTDLNEEP
jgi:hypothetical protein